MGAAHKIQNRNVPVRLGIVEAECIKGALRISLRINNFYDFTPISSQCHRSSIYTGFAVAVNRPPLGVIDQTSVVYTMPEGHTSKVIAIIDDNELMRDSLGDLIEAGGFEARCFGSAKAFLASDLHSRAACLIVDIFMPKMSGLELQARLKEEECHVPIIFITAFDDVEIRTQAMEEGAVEFFAKPFDHRLLFKMLRGTLDRETCDIGSPHLALAS